MSRLLAIVLAMSLLLQPVAQASQAEITTEDLPTTSVKKTVSAVEENHVRVVKIPEVIHFKEGSCVIEESEKPLLYKVFLTLIQYPKLHLVVWGKSDEKGRDKPNLDLSYKRADAVATYLLSRTYNGGKRLAASRIETAGSGEYKAGEGPEYMMVRFLIDGGYFVNEQGSPPPICGTPEADGKDFCQDINIYISHTENVENVEVHDIHVTTGGGCSGTISCPLSHLQPDRSWTLGQRLIASTIVGVMTGAGSAGVVYLADVHTEETRTTTGGHYENYWNVDRPEFLTFAGGFVGGFGATFWLSGYFGYDGNDGSFKVNFHNNGGVR